MTPEEREAEGLRLQGQTLTYTVPVQANTANAPGQRATIFERPVHDGVWKRKTTGETK